ncbi:MAG: hypothetical protein WKF37_20500 [Bryobacteraceae bacterium]
MDQKVSIVPCLRYRNAKRAIEWLGEAFQFEKHLVVPGEGEVIVHCQLTYRGVMIMLGSNESSEFGKLTVLPSEIGNKVTQAPYMVVPDIDAHYARAKASGAVMLIDIKDEDYGGRGYTCQPGRSYL